jgi:UDP-N-acetylmuramoylalanine--D-glutamate ligase
MIKNQDAPIGKEIVRIKILQTSSMKEAVEFAYKNTKNGKICLLSTASPSYTLRKNFEEKGNLFQQYIKELA